MASNGIEEHNIKQVSYFETIGGGGGAGGGGGKGGGGRGGFGEGAGGGLQLTGVMC